MTITARLILIALCIGTFETSARAELGARPVGKPTTSQNFNAQAVTSSDATSAAAKFQVFSSTAPNGSSIREYVSNNVVFAVSWSGAPSHPDLTQLLGSDVTTYQASLDSHPKKKGRAAHIVASDDLVVSKFGHQRDNRGLAYKKSLLPAGVTAADLH